jgi:hypothetical protein
LASRAETSYSTFCGDAIPPAGRNHFPEGERYKHIIVNKYTKRELRKRSNKKSEAMENKNANALFIRVNGELMVSPYLISLDSIPLFCYTPY